MDCWKFVKIDYWVIRFLKTIKRGIKYVMETKICGKLKKDVVVLLLLSWYFSPSEQLYQYNFELILLLRGILQLMKIKSIFQQT